MKITTDEARYLWGVGGKPRREKRPAADTWILPFGTMRESADVNYYSINIIDEAEYAMLMLAKPRI